MFDLRRFEMYVKLSYHNFNTVGPSLESLKDQEEVG